MILEIAQEPAHRKGLHATSDRGTLDISGHASLLQRCDNATHQTVLAPIAVALPSIMQHVLGSQHVRDVFYVAKLAVALLHRFMLASSMKLALLCKFRSESDCSHWTHDRVRAQMTSDPVVVSFSLSNPLPSSHRYWDATAAGLAAFGIRVNVLVSTLD